MSSPKNRPVFLKLLETLQTSVEVRVFEESDECFGKGGELFGKRLDKEWSLTDCISFAVMSEMKIADALTGDHHFEQAGYRALLR